MVRIKSKYDFKCERERVWDKLTDIDVLNGMISRSSGLREVGENIYEGGLRMELGPVYGRYEFRFEVGDSQRHESLTLNFESINSPVSFYGGGTFQLTQKNDIATLLYLGNLLMDGHVPGTFRKKAKRKLEQALEKLFRKIEKHCCAEVKHAH